MMLLVLQVINQFTETLLPYINKRRAVKVIAISCIVLRI